VLRTIPAILCTACLLLATASEAPAGPKSKARNARRAVARALETFDELVDQQRFADAASLADELAEAFPDDPVARLMQRQATLLARPPRDGSQLADERWTRAEEWIVTRDETKFVVATYPVADLVIPIPGMLTVGIDADRSEGRIRSQGSGIDAMTACAPTFDFDELVELVTSTIAPESWASAGGPGTIAVNETTLSVVIRQTRGVHDEIADLFSQLRRLQDVQVTLELRYVSVPDTFFERIGVDFDFAENVSANPDAPCMLVTNRCDVLPALEPGGHATLSGEETTCLLGKLQEHQRANIMFAPKVTLFNGQAAKIFNGDESGRLFRAVVSADRRKVHLRLGVDSTDSREVLHSVRDFVLKDGHTLLLDDGTFETEARVEAGVPILSKLPYVSRLYKNTGVGRETTRRLLLVTSRVIVQEEEEERLPTPRVSLDTPRGIIVEEEEPLLGLDR
jgi:hypothetical protein